MLNKKDFLKYASKTSLSDHDPKSDRNSSKHCGYGNAWICKPDCHVGFIPCEPVYFYSFLFILWYGHGCFRFMCTVLGEKVIKRL